MFGFLNWKQRNKSKNTKLFHGALPGFDEKFYLDNNPDVKADGIDPMLHFLHYGWKEGRDPSRGFSVNGYLQHNPDVRDAGLNPLVHFLEFGLAEGRSFCSPAATATPPVPDIADDVRRQLTVLTPRKEGDDASGFDEGVAMRRLWKCMGAAQKMAKTSAILGYDPPSIQS